jgi:hypothetical protein
MSQRYWSIKQALNDLLVPIIELNKMYTFDRKAKEGALY